MNRRDLIKSSFLASVGFTFSNKSLVPVKQAPQIVGGQKTAKNIIMLVSDGMSIGTLTMADLLLKQKEGKESNWLQLYRENKIKRALMDTASASSLVTDSAAASSSWGGGMRVNNGSLNVGPNGERPTPILQKFKSAGKAVGCVTTVPITHATPAGFCINNSSRSDMSEIAEQYLSLRFDVMMGGGFEYFSKDHRQDKRDLLEDYRSQDYQVVLSRDEMLQVKNNKPLLGTFYTDGLPYALDRASSTELQKSIPTLAEMTQVAIQRMKNNQEGFVLQVEAGKVDWAAHGNDVGALLYDQIAFDEAVKVAIEFADKDKETLVIITTDHGNANPGLIYSNDANKKFDSLQNFKNTNEWVLNKIHRDQSTAQAIEIIEHAQGIVISQAQAKELLDHYGQLNEKDLYNPKKLPFRKLATFQEEHTSVGWASMNHSADFVELGMYGPGSELLPPFIKNIDLHVLMLKAADMHKSYFMMN